MKGTELGARTGVMEYHFPASRKGEVWKTVCACLWQRQFGHSPEWEEMEGPSNRERKHGFYSSPVSPSFLSPPPISYHAVGLKGVCLLSSYHTFPMCIIIHLW